MLIRYLRLYNYCIRRDMTSIRSGPQYAFEYTATARMANHASLDAVDLTTLFVGWLTHKRQSAQSLPCAWEDKVMQELLINMPSRLTMLGFNKVKGGEGKYKIRIGSRIAKVPFRIEDASRIRTITEKVIAFLQQDGCTLRWPS